SVTRSLAPQTGGAIYAQGAIEITANFLDVNGTGQSGAQSLNLTIPSSFNPGGNTLLEDAKGNAVAGVSFGSTPIPVSGHFDASTQQIVLDPISPAGGSITLAGPI